MQVLCRNAKRPALYALQKRFAELLRTPLFEFHKKHGAKFVDFAGYEMPMQYTGLGAEHKACREGAAVFDVSHMGQWVVTGADRERFLETVTPIDFEEIATGCGSLSVITNKEGGIVDDTVIVKNADHIYMVVNAGCQEKDYAHVLAMLKDFDGEVAIERLAYGLIALQGPKAVEMVENVLGCQGAGTMLFMEQRDFGGCVRVTRCGYTGEDGFEISVQADRVEAVTSMLHEAGCTLAGLGARDTLRLEAGLCLYGNDIDETTTPVEAGLAWLISKRRRTSGGFTGATRILDHLNTKPKEDPAKAFKNKRVCLTATGPPARKGAPIRNPDGDLVGEVTSGTFSPTLKKNIAMAYVKRSLQKAGTPLQVEVRGKLSPAEVVKAPFVSHNYYKPPQ